MSRSLSLDVFRGITLAGMILVNHPGGPQTYPPLEHAPWNGLTPTDVIFPTFIFILGVALTFSLAQRTTHNAWKGRSFFDWIVPGLMIIKFITKIVGQTTPLSGYDAFFVLLIALTIGLPQLERRTGGNRTLAVLHHGVLLFSLGFIWDLNPSHPDSFRTLGILQRLGLIYIVCGILVLHTKRRTQTAIAAALLAIYWVMMKEIPVPGFGTGLLTKEGNLAGYIDRLIIGASHMYEPKPQPYWDPEGLFTTIPAIATGLLGALAGGVMRSENPLPRRIGSLFSVGCLFILAGLALTPWFPINKNLWSPSFVLLVGGIDMLLLSTCMWLVDLKQFTKPLQPFLALGSNSILIYLLAGTLMHYATSIPGGTWNGNNIDIREAAYHHLFESWLNPFNASLAMAMTYVVIWILIAGVLYRKRIFVKL